MLHEDAAPWFGAPSHPCRHCHRPFVTRAGRGLCRKCFDTPGVRELYPVVAPFGGAQASACWTEYQRQARKTAERPPQ
jgi:hypothetical protein